MNRPYIILTISILGILIINLFGCADSLLDREFVKIKSEAKQQITPVKVPEFGPDPTAPPNNHRLNEKYPLHCYDFSNGNLFGEVSDRFYTNNPDIDGPPLETEIRSELSDDPFSLEDIMELIDSGCDGIVEIGVPPDASAADVIGMVDAALAAEAACRESAEEEKTRLRNYLDCLIGVTNQVKSSSNFTVFDSFKRKKDLFAKIDSPKAITEVEDIEVTFVDIPENCPEIKTDQGCFLIDK